MDEGLFPYFARIQAAEAAIGRIRAAMAAGDNDAPHVADDWNFVRDTAVPAFVRKARQIDRLGPLAVEEAREAMEAKLALDVLSPTFASLETGFGSYLRDMPIRIVNAVRRKNTLGGASSPMEQLDAPVGDDGLLMHETVRDPHASDEIDAVANHEAIQAALAQLPIMQRQAFLLRTEGASNNDVADQLGVSAATATRLYQRARDYLQQQLRAWEE